MHHTIPEGDVLVIPGDFTNVGAKADVKDFNLWLKEQPCKWKVVIAGNHDWCFATKGKKKKSPGWLTAGDDKIIYLQDDEVIIDGVKFYGSPWQPEFCNWAFNLPRGSALRDKWQWIPNDTDVLITHGPPAGILDVSAYGNERLGCVDLLDRVYKVNPKVHAFGHIHSAYGTEQKMNTMFINAAICTESYLPANNPIVYDI